jgi:5-methylcytosine-specific restriction endonuclease McrA
LAAGLCVLCGKLPHTAGSKACQGCYLKQMSGWVFKNQRHAAELQDLWEKCGGRCAYTGLPLTLGVDAELDHIVPESRGGTHDVSNLQWIHFMVNQMKFDYPEADFLAMVAAIYRHRVAPGA